MNIPNFDFNYRHYSRFNNPIQPQSPLHPPSKGPPQPPNQTNPHYSFQLQVAQQPSQARATGWSSKADSRRPVDPPPVLSIEVKANDTEITHQVPSMFIVHTTLLSLDDEVNHSTAKGVPAPSRLAGTTVVSLTHIRNPPPGKFFFILNDLSIRQEGYYKLKFRVFEVPLSHSFVYLRGEIDSSVITVYSPKNFPGLAMSSNLIKDLASKGHKVRVRKESTLQMRRKKKSSVVSSSGAVATTTTTGTATSSSCSVSPTSATSLPSISPQNPQDSNTHISSHHSNTTTTTTTYLSPESVRRRSSGLSTDACSAVTLVSKSSSPSTPLHKTDSIKNISTTTATTDVMAAAAVPLSKPAPSNSSSHVTLDSFRPEHIPNSTHQSFYTPSEDSKDIYPGHALHPPLPLPLPSPPLPPPVLPQQQQQQQQMLPSQPPPPPHYYPMPALAQGNYQLEPQQHPPNPNNISGSTGLYGGPPEAGYVDQFHPHAHPQYSQHPQHPQQQQQQQQQHLQQPQHPQQPQLHQQYLQPQLNPHHPQQQQQQHLHQPEPLQHPHQQQLQDLQYQPQEHLQHQHHHHHHQQQHQPQQQLLQHHPMNQ